MDLHKEMLKVMEQKKFLTIYENGNLEEGYTGLVLQTSDNEILMKNIDFYGNEDGYCVRRIENIVCYNTGGMDIYRKRQLWEEKKHSHVMENFFVEEENLMTGMLAYAIKNREPVFAFCEECVYAGWVCGYSDEIVILNELTPYGEDEGELWLKREYIDALETGSPDLQIRKKFWEKEVPKCDGRPEKSFYRKLKKYKGSLQLFEIYADSDWENCYVGTIEYVTKKELAIKHIDSEGHYDGYVVLDLEAVMCICQKSRYLSKIQKNNKCDTTQIKLEMDGENLSDEVLRFAQRKSLPVFLEIGTQGYYGDIEQWTEEWIQLRAVDLLGNGKGTFWILREWIDRIWVDNQILREVWQMACDKHDLVRI